MKKKFMTSLGGMVLMVSLLTACTVKSNTVASGPQVRMGQTNFIDNSVTIQEGQSIVLVDMVNSTHIITDGTWKGKTAVPGTKPGEPQVNLTFSNAGQKQSIGPFTSTRTFQFYCTVHPGMNLTVNVK